MNDPEQDSFERELRELAPAKIPRALSDRLATTWNTGNQDPSPRQCARISAPRLSWLRWLAPAAAAAVIGIALILHHRGWKGPAQERAGAKPMPAALDADDVEIDRRLVRSFDAVATLPGGEPVQVQCREWMDQVVLRDTARGLAIQQRTPRFEIVPVEFETF